MWEKMTKVSVSNVIAVLVIVCAFGLAYISAFKVIPQASEVLINKVIDVTLMGVIGWLFTRNKNTPTGLS